MSKHFAINISSMLRGSGLDASIISDYIAAGRAQVIGTPDDRYAGERLPQIAIFRDANTVATAFNSARHDLTTEQMLAWHTAIVSLQHGPKSPRYREAYRNLQQVL